ncbi:hypothetical protein FDECE_87 [Fusarium decemcellulare]|nr:hypothetical protein FDECE_87 [Fusarium decemcellulare]
MADILTPVPGSSYLLGKGFWMPGPSGDKWAIAFNSRGATLLTASLSVVVAVSFVCLWNLVTLFGMLFGGTHSRRRYVALVTLWNSSDPWFAFMNLSTYFFHCWRDIRTRRAENPAEMKASRGDLWYGLVLCLIAFTVFSGGLAMGIVAPSLVQIGNVAPVRPSTLFYPAVPEGNLKATLKDYGIRATSAMRSLGSVEATKVTARKEVSVTEDKLHASWEGNPVRSVKYSYHVSGADMGLKGGSELSLNVEGYCITEYEWAIKRSPAQAGGEYGDLYELWNNKSRVVWIPLNQSESLRAPFLAFRLHPDSAAQWSKGSNTSYAVVIYSAHRGSMSRSDDPWYATERRPNYTFRNDERLNHTFWMKRYRPVLSCWELDQWSYRGQNVSSVYRLKHLPGIKIKEVLLRVLESTFSGGPMVIRLGNASGDLALRSSTTSLNGIIDAAVCKMRDDIERLILASYVATRNIFRDAIMFGQHHNLTNVFEGPDGKPKDGSGEFVVSSPDIQTFSLAGIVTLLLILGFLVLANTCAWAVLKYHHNSSAAQDEGAPALNQDIDRKKKQHVWTRFDVLSAVQIFRCLYESGKDVTNCDWSCEKMVIDNGEGREFRLIHGCGTAKCMGNIMKDEDGRPAGDKRDTKPEGMPLLDLKKGLRESINPTSPETP